MRPKTQFPPIVVLLLAVSVFTTADPVKAAEAGAWETFSTEVNADAWAVYNYFDNTTYYPNWQGTPAGAEYVYFWHNGDEPLWFFADTTSNIGDGAMVGDFAEAGVQAILVDVLIDSLVDFDQVDCALGVRDSGGNYVYYYSESFYDEDFGGEGWYNLRFGFERSWYRYVAPSWVAVELTPEILSSVEEVGFRFYPKTGTTASVFSAIDDVKLEPRVVAPVLDVSATAADFRLAFTPGIANSCAIQKLATVPSVEWEDVIGEGFITGPGAHVFTTPLAGRGIYRVQSFADYTPIVTSP